MCIAPYYQNPTWDFIIAPFTFPDMITWVYVLGLGLFATFSQIFMTKAYSLAAGGIVGTIGYTNILFSIIIGLFLGDSFPSFMVILGILTIIFSGYLVSTKKG
jgi:drug/metabolite transporter (DMT)-like permease